MPIARERARARSHTPHHLVLHYFRRTAEWAGPGRPWPTSGITLTSTSSTSRPSLNSWFSWPPATGSCPPTALFCSTYRETAAFPPRLRPRTPRKLLETLFDSSLVRLQLVPSRKYLKNTLDVFFMFFCHFHSFSLFSR